MKRKAAAAALLLSTLFLLCSCGAKKAEFDPNAVYLGDAVSCIDGEEKVGAEAQKGWEEYKKQAAEQVKTDGSKAVGDVFMQDAENQVVALINQERSKAGLAALRQDPAVNAAAEMRAQEAATSYSHTRPDGRSCDTIYDDLGITIWYYGENLGQSGASDAGVIVSAWMNSAAHKANILTSDYGRTGVGCYVSGGCVYWAQLFAD